jgi:hypothetical protein
MRIHAFLAVSALFINLAQSVLAQTGSVEVDSPNGQIRMTIATVEKNTISGKGGQLAFQIAFGGKRVFEWSQLALELNLVIGGGAAVRIMPAR